MKLSLVCAVLLVCAGTTRATIDYTVSLKQPEEHIFGVTITVPQVKGELKLQMPAWNATYQIRDFASRIQNMRVVSSTGSPAPLRKADKLTWVAQGNGTLQATYEIYWDDGGPFSSQLNGDHAFINFAMLLMYVPSRRNESVSVRFTDVPATWKTALALKPGAQANSYVAANYDALVDAPAELSPFEESRFEANRAKIRVVIHGGSYPRDQLLDMLQRVVAYQTALMREVPFEEFTFIYHFGSGGGGMEHANSTAINSSGARSPNGLSAHEFFHLWNVKRIRPQSMEPVDYTQENWTRALWFAEGVTSTYASYSLVRTGLWTPQEFYNDVADEFSVLQARPARLWKSVEEASLDAWHEKYPHYNRPAYSISYYNKGQIIGILLDILIREATQNRRSLDDVLRDLNTTYAQKGQFYGESAAIRASAEKIAGRSFAEFFERYVAGTDELPYAEILKRAGLDVTVSGSGRGSYSINESLNPTPLARRIRDGLLKGTTEP